MLVGVGRCVVTIELILNSVVPMLVGVGRR